VTGGLGKLGLVIAEFLADQAGAKLVLTSRSPFPATDRWDEWLAAHPDDNRTAQRIRSLRALEARGAEVLAVPGDVASPASMLHVLDLAHERFGPVHGVVHAAADMSADAFFEVGQVGDENVELSFGPKARGLMTLHHLLRSDPVELWLLVSSISTVLGGVGYSAYAAANAYLEAFAQAQRRRSAARWISIAWDACRFDGAPDETALGPADVADALARILAQPRPHLAVSATDLNARIRRWVSPTAEPASQAHPGVEPGAANGAAELVLAELFRDVLGVDAVRSEDDFFADHGGDSLLAVQLASRIRARFSVELPLRAIFDSPTPIRLAETVRAAAGAPSAAGAASEATAIPRAPRRIVVASDESSYVAT
jgi:NAD(P)-dependent dehydrogenase (short-subunit alcohol dehydrogenase family)/acyl carrier protein